MTNGVTSLHGKSRAAVSSDHAAVEGRLFADRGRAAAVEGRWLSWGRSVFAVAVVLVLIALGVANIAMRARWHEVEDGVLWGARPEGLTAAREKVAPERMADQRMTWCYSNDANADEVARDRLYEGSRREGLGFGRMYPHPVHEIAEIRPSYAGGDSFPVADTVARTLITLPTHRFVNDADRARIGRLLS